MRCFVGEKGVVDGEAGASSLVPGGRFSDVVAEIRVSQRTSSSKS